MVEGEEEEIWMAAMDACADWAIQGPLGQLKVVADSPSTMSCITRGAGAGAGGVVDIVRERRKEIRSGEGAVAVDRRCESMRGSA